jgi:ribonuclease Z
MPILSLRQMEIVLLGTGSPLPDPNRAGPATLVRAGGTTLLFDAGRGVVMRLAAAACAPGMLSALMLTHLHSDHLCGLTDVVTSRWVTSFAPSPLRLIGPERTAEVVDGMLAMLRPDIEYRLGHHADLTWEPPFELSEARGGVVFDEGGVTVTAGPTDHRPVQPTLGYRIDHDGKSIVIAGDTVPCTGLDELCAGADAIVHTVIRSDLIGDAPIQRLRDVCDYHSSVEDAARTAARAGASTLVLTHYVPAPAPGDEESWRKLAAEHFDGRVELGDDLLTVTV